MSERLSHYLSGILAFSIRAKFDKIEQSPKKLSSVSKEYPFATVRRGSFMCRRRGGCICLLRFQRFPLCIMRLSNEETKLKMQAPVEAKHVAFLYRDVF